MTKSINIFLYFFTLTMASNVFAQGFSFLHSEQNKYLVAEHIFQNNSGEYLLSYNNAYYQPDFYQKVTGIIVLDASGNVVLNKEYPIDTLTSNVLYIDIIKDADSVYIAKVQRRNHTASTTAVGMMVLNKQFDILDSLIFDIPAPYYGVPQFQGFWDSEGYYNFIFTYYESQHISECKNGAGRIKQDLSDHYFILDINSNEIISTISPRMNNRGALIVGDYSSVGKINITDSTFQTIDTTLFNAPLNDCIFSSFQGHIKQLNDSQYITCTETNISSETNAPISTVILNDSLSIVNCTYNANHDFEVVGALVDQIQARIQNIGITPDYIYIGGTQEVGTNYYYGGFSNRLVVLQYNHTLDTLWRKYIHNDELHYLMQGLIQTQDNGCVLYGCYNYINDPETGGIFVIKIDENGSTSSTKQINTNKADVISVSPNPASSFLYVNLPQNYLPNDFTLSIYDANGLLKIHQTLK
ncbi:MAG: hypothetical protein WAS72_03155, partial [Saprospiraceae bacterium]